MQELYKECVVEQNLVRAQREYEQFLKEHSVDMFSSKAKLVVDESEIDLLNELEANCVHAQSEYDKCFKK